jgi:hypothetical protein
MKRFILTAVALAFVAVLGLTTNLEAAPHHAVSHGHVAVHVNGHAYGHRNLVYRGHSYDVRIHERRYRGWTSRCWFAGYRTYGYYCGTDQSWYYWYAPYNEYLPVSYMSAYPPTAVAIVPTNVIPINAVPATSPGLPQGATLVPGPIPVTP